jgi:hypothetical protein
MSECHQVYVIWLQSCPSVVKYKLCCNPFVKNANYNRSMMISTFYAVCRCRHSTKPVRSSFRTSTMLVSNMS